MTSPRHERMSSVDTAWLRMDRPGHMMMIVGVATTETPLSFSRFRSTLEQHFLRFARFRQRPVPDALGGTWVDDDHFDLDAHLERVSLRSPQGPRELQELAATLASTPLDSSRPLWHFSLVERYRGGSAWILRIHHCYADGIAMVRVLLSMTTAEGGAQRPREATPRSGRKTRAAFDLLPMINWVGEWSEPARGVLEGALTGSTRLFRGLVMQALHPAAALSSARHAGGMAGELAKVLALPDDPDTPFRGALSGQKVVAWNEPLPLTEFRTIAKALDCTINDVLMSTIAGALGSYLRANGHDTRTLSMRATVPVNLRGAGDPVELGNRFGLVFVDLPLGLRNPLQRVYAMHETMAALKRSMQPPMVLAMLSVLGSLPAAVQSPAIELFSRKATAVVSNVPGPRTSLLIAGQRISQMLFWVPQSGSIGLGISVLTYAGQVHFGIIADRSVVADPQALIERFAPEFEKLLLAVTVGALALKQREAPGAASRRDRRDARVATAGTAGRARRATSAKSRARTGRRRAD